MPTNLQLLEKANRTAALFGQTNLQHVAGTSADLFPRPQVTFHYQPQFLDLADQLLCGKPAGESFSVGICPVRSENSIGRFVTLFGASMSQLSSSPVLLIETDFQHPCLARYLGAPAAPGLREMLAPAPKNRFDCIHPTRYRNLHLLPVGAWANGREPRHMKRGLKWVHGLVTKHYQSVIIAFPAWNALPGVRSCYALADAMVLAVRPDSCGAFTVRRAVRRLRKARVNLIGSVLSELEQ